MATVRERPQPKPATAAAAPGRRPAPRRLKVAIRRVSPVSVLKFSLVFYLCLMLVIVIGLSILFMVVDALGIIDSVEEFMSSLWEANFEVHSGFLLRMLVLIGIISVALWSALTVFVAFLYNLIADLVGGIEVTLQERR